MGRASGLAAVACAARAAAFGRRRGL